MAQCPKHLSSCQSTYRRVVVDAFVLQQGIRGDGRAGAFTACRHNDHLHFRYHAAIDGADAFGLVHDLGGDDTGSFTGLIEIVSSRGEFRE